MIKVTIKTAITLAATRSADGGLLFKAGIFGVVYAFMTYHMWYMDKRGGFFDFIRKCGFSVALIAIVFMIFSPLVPLATLSLIINTIETGETADAFISILVSAAGFGCFTRDFMRTCRTIKRNWR